MNYLEISSKKLEELSEIKFLTEKNEILKNLIINLFVKGNTEETINTKIKKEHDDLIKNINENSNIEIIAKNKTNQDIADLLDDLISDHKEQDSLKKIESLEQKLINNLDESSYSELIKLKSQLNRE